MSVPDPTAGVTATRLEEYATAWVERVSGTRPDNLMEPGGDVPIGGRGMLVSLADYLVLVEALASECRIAQDRLLRLRPPYTVRTLIEGALRAARERR